MKHSKKHLYRSALAGIALSLALPGAAGAVTLYGSVGNGSGANRGDIVAVNQSNGSTSVIGNPTTSGGITGIDFDNDGNLWGSTLFGQGSSSTLIQIDPDNGSLISTVGTVTAIDGADAGSTLSIGDLAYNKVTNTLFGITSNAKSISSGGDIYTIDTGTGMASFVGSTIWDTNAGISFDSAGNFYALGFDPDVGPDGTNMLFTLDTSDGSELSRLTVSENNFIFAGLGINPGNGEIFAMEQFTGNVFRFDGNLNDATVTGAMTLVGMPADTFMSDLAFRVPAPGGVAILALGVISFAYSRRRRAV